jgi:glyoxalase family protein
VADDESLGFWARRLGDAGIETSRGDRSRRFADPEGLGHELVIAGVPDEPLAARAPDVAPEYALQGFHGVRAYGSEPRASAKLLEALGFRRTEDDGWEAAGVERRGRYGYDTPPQERGRTSAGTVHHIAWSVADDAELTAFAQRAVAAGARATPIVDRQHFHSVYFREPNGVLFELASRDIGFDTGEPLETLDEELKLPARHEHLRDKLQHRLKPLENPRAGIAG